MGKKNNQWSTEHCTENTNHTKYEGEYSGAPEG